MSSYGKYSIPEKIEDQFLRSVAPMAKEVLKEKKILEDIFQKYIVAYNKISKESCSAKSLNVMNQNHKLVFSTITSSRVIKSPRFSSVSAEKGAKVPGVVDHQLRTPRKTNRISSSTERKRLSFDNAENEYMISKFSFKEDSGKCQMSLGSSFFKHEHEAEFYDSPEERFKLNGIPESVATVSTFNQAAENLTTKPPDKDQTMAITPDKKYKTPADCIVKEEENAWYLECRPSIFSHHIVPKASDNSKMYIQERFNPERKPETITSRLDNYDHENEYLSTKTLDNHRKMVTSPEKKNNTLFNYAMDKRKSARYLGISPSFFNSTKDAENSDKQNTIDQECLRTDEKHETVSSLSVDHLKDSCISFKTPEKLQTFPFNSNKEEKTPINQILVKKVIVKNAVNVKEGLSPVQDGKTPNNAKIKKLKSVDYSDVSSMDADNFIHDDSFKGPDDLIVDQDVAQSDGKSIMSAIPINNNCESMSVSPDKKSELLTYEESTKQDCTTIFLTEADKKKIPVEVLSDLINSNDYIIKLSALETNDVESVTNLMQTFSPPVKRSYEHILQKSMTDRSVDDETISFGKLRLRDKLSKTTIPPRDCLISYEMSPKPDDLYAIQAIKFIEMLKQRKSRFSMYLHLFFEDKHDLRFICTYIEKLANVIQKLSFNYSNEVLGNAIDKFVHKGLKLKRNATSWESDIVKDIEVWENCIQKVNHLQQDIKQFRKDQKQMTQKKFQKWEKNFRIVNKKADDMTLLREIKRPTVIQFGCELESLIQSFIQILLVVGLLKLS